MTLPTIDPARDPGHDARTMGRNNIVVLPAPIHGTVTYAAERVAYLDFALPAEATPVLVQQLVHRLAATCDRIVWKVITDAPIGAILEQEGFFPEIRWNPQLRGQETVLSWYPPVADDLAPEIVVEVGE